MFSLRTFTAAPEEKSFEFVKTGFAPVAGGEKTAREEKLKTGTTTVGLVCRDGIVLAADQKATMGHLIASKEAKKIYEILPKMAMTIAGDVGDAQAMVRLLRAETRLYELQEKAITVKATATLMGNILRGSYKSYMPEMVMLILGGMDERGGQLYSLTPDGAVMDEREYTFSGSGSVIALGVLEDSFKKDLSADEGAKIAVRAIKAARERDIYTGGREITVAIITKEGLKWMPREKVEEIIKENTKK